MSSLNNLESFLRELINKLHSVRRWMRRKDPTPESVLEHTFKQAVLAMILILFEQKQNEKKFDAFQILSGIFLHDWAESVMGDIPFHIKHDSRVKEGLKTIEREQFIELIREKLPLEIIEDLIAAYDLQQEKDGPENKLFQATEILGYLFFALEEVRAGKSIFKETLKQCFQRLKPLATEFKSVQIFYKSLAPEIEKLLAEKVS